MKNNILKLMKSNIHIKKNIFTDKTNNYLRDLYKVIKNSYNIQIPKTIKPIYHINYIQQEKNNYNYIPQELRYKIENTLNVNCEYNFNIGERKIKTNIITSNKKKNQTHHIFSMIYRWLIVIDKIILNPNNKNLTIFIFLTDENKKLPKKTTEVISKVNVNTGFYVYYDNEIYIYRNEEWFKTLIHETFHSACLDNIFSTEFSKINNNLSTLFPINASINFSETYTEFMAEIIKNMYIAAHPSQNNGWEYFKECINNEILFSIFQANKVLNFMGLEYEDLFLRDDETRKTRIKYRQNTEVFSYYILKSILMFNINDFLNYCIKNNMIDNLQLKNNNNTILHIYNYISLKHDTIELIETYYIADEILHILKKNNNIEDLNTLRMTWYN